MPTYVYKFVDTGETIEVQQAFTDDTLSEYTHPDSGEPMAVKKVFQPVGVTFKGSGFFKTDNRGESKKSSSNDAGADGSTSSESKSSSSESPATSESKKSEKSGSAASSGSTATSSPSTSD